MVNFSCEQNLLGVLPQPVPASKAIPEYFKRIKPQSDHNPKNGTVKRCVPFLDALTAGFIIPMWCDVYVFARQGELSVEFPSNFPLGQSLESHDAQQIPKHPLADLEYGNTPLKWFNPWVVGTEPGVSCLFTSPLNHMETRFKLLDGIVDTDVYYNNVNLPFFWTGGDGEFFIAKGTPLVQVIPFRRETHTLEVTALDQKRLEQVRGVLGTKIKNGYRDELWHNKKTATTGVLEEPTVDVSSAQHLEWLAEGNEPLPADEPIADAG